MFADSLSQKLHTACLDNNPAEWAIRPLAIKRKSWLFFGSLDSGEAAATLLSLIQSCRALNINLRTYLEDVCRRIIGQGAHKLYELLPDAWLKAQAPPIKLPLLEKMGLFPADVSSLQYLS